MVDTADSSVFTMCCCEKAKDLPLYQRYTTLVAVPLMDRVNLLQSTIIPTFLGVSYVACSLQ